MGNYVTQADFVGLGFSFEAGDASAVTEICTRASRLVDGLAHETFAKTEDTETLTEVAFDGSRLVVFPRHMPVTSVKALSVDNDGTVLAVDLTTVVINNDLATLAFQNPGLPKYADASAVLRYEHGFDQIPEAVKAATVTMALPMLIDYFMAKNGALPALNLTDGDRAVANVRTFADARPVAIELLGDFIRVR